MRDNMTKQELNEEDKRLDAEKEVLKSVYDFDKYRKCSEYDSLTNREQYQMWIKAYLKVPVLELWDKLPYFHKRVEIEHHIGGGRWAIVETYRRLLEERIHEHNVKVSNWHFEHCGFNAY